MYMHINTLHEFCWWLCKASNTLTTRSIYTLHDEYIRSLLLPRTGAKYCSLHVCVQTSLTVPLLQLNEQLILWNVSSTHQMQPGYNIGSRKSEMYKSNT